MTADEFVAAGVRLWGKRWKRPMAKALGRDEATIWRYATEKTAIPGPVAAAIGAWLVMKAIVRH